LKYEVTVDDPEPIPNHGPAASIFVDSGAELFEYVCQENNRVEETNEGADGATRRTSLIVP